MGMPSWSPNTQRIPTAKMDSTHHYEIGFHTRKKVLLGKNWHHEVKTHFEKRSIMISISVNGVPLAIYVDEQTNDEITANHKQEIGTTRRSIGSHIITRKIRNISGSRSGRGRIIYSANAGGAQ